MITKKLSDKKDDKAEELLKRTLLHEAQTNNDGFFINDQAQNIRTISTKEAEEAIGRANFDTFMSHFRLISTGKLGVDNVHGWKNGDWIFFHNGTISDYVFYEYGSYKTNYKKSEQEQSDSRLFFDDLVYNINKYEAKTDKEIARTIEDFLSSCSFWGRAALYNKQTDKMFLFGSWYMYLVHDNYLTFSSCALDFTDTLEKKINAHGAIFDKEVLPNILEERFDGLAIITDFSKPNFAFKITNDNLVPYNYKATRTVYTVCQQLIDKNKEPEKKEDKYEQHTLKDDYINEGAYDEFGQPPYDLDYIIDDLGTMVEVYVEDSDAVHAVNNACCESLPKLCERYETIYWYENGISEEALKYGYYTPNEETGSEAENQRVLAETEKNELQF